MGTMHLYALSKIAQEIIVRFHDQMSSKTYGVIRLGTVLGENMPEKTAANIFISRGIKGDPITPYKHSLYRPILYVDVNDVCRAFESYVKKILNYKIKKEEDGISNIVNLTWSSPTTVKELAEIVQEEIIKLTKGRMKPEIKIIDRGLPSFHDSNDCTKILVDTTKIKNFLGLMKLTDPKESIKRIVQMKLQNNIK